MTDQNDKEKAAEQALLAREKLDLVYDFFHGQGLDEASAMMCARSEVDSFNWNSVRLTYGKDKKSVLDPSVIESYRLKLPALFKKPDEKKIDNVAAVDPVTVAQALAGNITAKGRLFSALKIADDDPHSAEKVEAFLIAERLKLAPADNGERDRDTKGRFVPAAADSNNPYSKDGPVDPIWLASALKGLGVKTVSGFAAKYNKRLDGSKIGAPFEAHRFGPDGRMIIQ